MYRSPICIRQRDNRLGSSMNVVAGPVKLNTGTGAAGLVVSNRTSLSGDVAAALATFRTPHDEFSMFRKFRTSTLSWNVWRVSPPTVKSCRIRRSTLLYHGLGSPFTGSFCHSTLAISVDFRLLRASVKLYPRLADNPDAKFLRSWAVTLIECPLLVLSIT